MFTEEELAEKSSMQKMHIPNSDKPVTFYNLDVIISEGYHVKSKQGTQFRIWATNVLRDYLLKGYATQRLESGTDLRYIQELLGHNSSRTTEIYTHVSTKNLQQIKSPFDDL